LKKKITNHNYGFKNEIKNKSNFDKRTKKKIRIKVEILVNNWITFGILNGQQE